MRIIAVSLVAVLAIATAASADVITTITIADTALKSSQNATPTGWPSAVNYGTATDIYPTPLSQTVNGVRMLLKFDLSGVQGTVNSATLTFFHTTNATFTAYRLTDEGWTELGSTWFSKDGANAWATPGGDFDSGVSASSGLSLAQTMASLDVTAMVQVMVNNSQATGTFMVVSDQTAGARVWSKENTGYLAASRRPTLTVDSVAVPEPATMALLVLGGMGLLARRRNHA